MTPFGDGKRVTQRMKRFRATVQRSRQPGEMPLARVAIRNHCLECVAYVAQEVRLCTAPNCWLYPWRFGATPERSKHIGETVDFAEDDGKSGGKSPNQAQNG